LKVIQLKREKSVAILAADFFIIKSISSSFAVLGLVLKIRGLDIAMVVAVAKTR
jgi:hypothetical protein